MRLSSPICGTLSPGTDRSPAPLLEAAGVCLTVARARYDTPHARDVVMPM
jgi:hypothetical protein